MSVSLTTPGVILCNGDRWPCRAFYDAGTLSTARDARRDARAAGWQVNIQQAGSRRRLDRCPAHTP